MLLLILKKVILNRILIALKIMHHLLFLIFRILFVCNAIWMCAFKLFFQCLYSGLIVRVFQFFKKYIFFVKNCCNQVPYRASSGLSYGPSEAERSRDDRFSVSSRLGPYKVRFQVKQPYKEIFKVKQPIK